MQARDLIRSIPVGRRVSDPASPDGSPSWRQIELQTWLPIIAVALAIGVVIASMPSIGTIAVAGAIGLVVLLAVGRQLPRAFLGLLVVLLIAFAFLNKGAAYIGAYPVYVGELVMGVGILAWLIVLPRSRFTILHALILAFMAWGLVRTIPYFSIYGFDAARDAVTWLYAIFALVVSAIVTGPHIRRVVELYGKVLPFFLLWVPFAAVLSLQFGSLLPNVPGSNVPIVVFKVGDIGVQLAGIASFVLVGLYAMRGNAGIGEPVIWVLWLVAASIVAALNRGAMLAIFASGVVVFFVRSWTQYLRVAFVGIAALALLLVANPSIDLGAERKLSFEQLVSNVGSVFSDTSDSTLEGSKEWRLAWWNTIIDYTIHGQYFWTGKGFGINLANADGFQVASDLSLRAPHNAHLEILARAGVPGLGLWILLQAAYGLSLARAIVQSRRARQTFWVRVLAWLFTYWVAGLVNMSFDVYLGGPQGGIWFWALFGLGMAAMAAAARERAAPQPESEPAAPEAAVGAASPA